MRLLLDSSGPGVIVALADSEGVVVERWHESGSALSRDIGQAAGEVLGELAIEELDQIVVGLGPGTFIGTRIAISYANGLAAASGNSVRGVNSLEAISAVVGQGRSIVVRDARRDDVYWFDPRDQQSGQQTRIVAIADLSAELEQHSVDIVIMEQAGSNNKQQQKVWSLIRPMLTEAGVTVVAAPGVPAEGLRRLGSLVESQEYVEPIYLRDFL